MKKITLFAVLILTVSFAAATPNRAALADCDRVVVVGTDITEQAENTPPTDNWVLYKRAAGIGSYELVTPTDADKATLFNFDHNNTKLSDIDKIGYSTYRTAGNAQQVA